MDSTTPITQSDGPFRVTWSAFGAVKRVEISNRVTGTRVIGTDWASWDNAYQQALRQLLSTGELAEL
jgi:hypothetical protein